MMEELPLISVIVPVYNTGEYLRGCLDSIRNQTYSNIEILLVNDGSTDHSLDVCNEYANMDSRFKVIDKENGGVGSARNAGLDNLHPDSKFITFVDSDDRIDHDCIEILYSHLQENGSDISMTGFYNLRDGNFVFHIFDANYYVKNYTTEEFIDDLLDENFKKHVTFSVLWSSLFKRELFEGIRCPLVKSGEDAAVTYKVYLKASKITYVNQGKYCYVQRPGSVSGNWKDEQLLSDWLWIQEERIAILMLLGYNVDKFINHYRATIPYIEYNSKIYGMENTEAYKRIKEKLDLYTYYQDRKKVD